MGSGEHGRAVLLAAALPLLGALPAVAAQVVRISTENDLLGGGVRDDHYTFSVAFEVEARGHTVSVSENAFTDRAAGVRFDETYLSVRRVLPPRGPWNLEAEAGLVRVGRGLFGESVQNAVHRLIGGDEVELRYLRTELHPRLALGAERELAAGDGFELGAQLAADLVPELRSLALAGLRAHWRPSDLVAVEVLAGVRFAVSDYDALEPHLKQVAPAAHAGIVLGERLFVSWSWNDHGDGREHLSAGYRFTFGARPGRGD